MMEPITTERLILRSWKDSDYLPFFRINSDPDVMEYFPVLLSHKESDEMATEIQHRINKNGWGFWAVEEKKSKMFIGFVGLNQPTYELPFNPCVEIGWRLSRKFWGYGYATEAANSTMEYAFDILSLNEVVAFTPVSNKRSRAVMERLGMTNSCKNFNHPKVPNNSTLKEHVLYKITREQWQSSNT